MCMIRSSVLIHSASFLFLVRVQRTTTFEFMPHSDAARYGSSLRLSGHEKAPLCSSAHLLWFSAPCDGVDDTTIENTFDSIRFSLVLAPLLAPLGVEVSTKSALTRAIIMEAHIADVRANLHIPELLSRFQLDLFRSNQRRAKEPINSEMKCIISSARNGERFE